MCNRQRIALLTLVVALSISHANTSLAGDQNAPSWRYSFNLKCRTTEEAGFDQARAFGVEIYEDRGKAVYITEAGMLAVGEFAQSKPRPPTWLHRLDLKVRPAGFEAFPLKTFGLEVLRDEHNGHWMYICQTGALGVVPGAGSFKAKKSAKAANWLHALAFKVRKAGQQSFDKDSMTWELEVYRDDNTGNLVYISSGGLLTVAPTIKQGPVPTANAKAAIWLNGFSLKVRKAASPPATFATFSVEAYRDENNGNLVYISHTGNFAVVPCKKKLDAPLPQPQPPDLTQQFTLKCRKAGEQKFGSLAFGIAAYTDRNTDCIIYVSEMGAIAVVKR
jgi:hypothetical protein